MTEPKNIDEVLLAIQAEQIVLAKDKKGQVGNQKTKYADLVQVNDVLLKRLNAYQTTWVCRPHLEGASFGLHYSLKHIPSDTEISGVWPLKLAENPQQMGSATTYGRRYALLAVTGVVAEEEDDDGDQASGRRTAQRAADRRPTGEGRGSIARRPGPALPGEVDGGITVPQQRRMHALFGAVGMTQREDRLRYAGEVINRELASSSDLTAAEANRVIDQLDKWAKGVDSTSSDTTKEPT